MLRNARSAVVLTGLVAAAVLLAVLAGAGTSKASAQAGGTLNIAAESDLASADNIQIRITTDRLLMGSTVFEPLFTSGPDGQPTPALAKSAVASSGGKVWTFKLQGGVKFQDGKPFTSKDVQANFGAILNPKNASDLAGDFANISRIERLGPLTVRFVLKVPDNSFPGSVTDTAFIGDMNARAKMGATAWAQHPIGTGPYEWVSRTVGDNLTFKRFDGYWRGRPPLDKVVFKIIPDPTVATLALKNGDVDVLTNSIDTKALPSLRKSFKVLSTPSNTLYQAFLNFGKPRVSQYKKVLAFHQGLAYLFNAQGIVPKILGGFGVYTDQPLPTWQAGHDPNLKPYPFDAKKGIQLLTQAGFPLGSTLIFVVKNAPELCPVATAIQSAITQLGYKVDLTCSDADAAGTGPSYTWDVVFTRTSGRVSSSVFFNDRWRRSLAQAQDDYYTYQNAKLESTIDSLQAQSDPKKATALAQQAADIIVRSGVADIPLYFPNTWVVASKKVIGLKLSPLGWQSMLMNSYTSVHLGS